MPEEIDWKQIVPGARAGRQDAARILVQELYPSVMRVCFAHRPFAIPAEDIAQEVFLKVFQNLHQFRGDSPFPHWVTRIAYTTCLEHHRKRRARPEIRMADLHTTEGVVIEAASVDDTVEKNDRLKIVRGLIGQLSAEDRMAVTLIDLEGKSVEEACELTGWGRSQMKIRAWRARRKLGAMLRRLNLEDML